MNKRNWTKRACALFVMCAATAITLPAQTFTVLHSFDGTDGDLPDGTMVQATNGNLYGTTQFGGAHGGGAVFKITPSGTLTTLYSFCPQSGCTDGSELFAGLVQATDGNFYGTTEAGGANGDGTVFKITSEGVLTTLYSFCPQTNCPDGRNPIGGLVQATDGNFYGTTGGGGANGNYGTVFKITPGGALTTLYSFCTQSGCTDGDEPAAGLVQATNGNFYGTTQYGGANAYYGTLFKITSSGTLTTLHSFDGTDGDYPIAALIQATDGNLYGTTLIGGANGEGTVFKITSSGTLTTLHSFDGTDGDYPTAALIQATDGNFYGTTEFGANNTCRSGCGTIFKITPSGTLTTLHSFNNTDGASPVAGLVQDTNGNFYGTTDGGGASDACAGGCGTVFSLSVGLGPFVETRPTLGPVGSPVKILGTSLTGATSVTFNGTAATFKVNSTGTVINATVPSGATTGTVQVVTPGGTLASNVPFRVRH